MITLKEMRLLQWEKNGPLIYFSTAIILSLGCLKNYSGYLIFYECCE